MHIRARTAFTLVELLVSMAVLVLLIVIVGQLVSSTTAVTSSSRKQLDADAQARMVFDRMAIDLERMVRRKDVDYIFARQSSANGGGNDKLFFYSEAPAYYNNPSDSTGKQKSSVSLIGYRINSSYQLERLGKALAWDGGGSNPGGMNFLAFPTGSTTPVALTSLAGNWSGTIGTAPAYSGTDSDYHVLAESVYRMEVCFQVKDLTNPYSPGAAYSNYPIAYFATSASHHSTASTSAPSNPNAGDRWYDTTNTRAFLCSSVAGNIPTWQSLGVDDVSGVVVTIALLDTGSRKIINDPSIGAIQTSVGDKMIGVFSDPKDSDLQSNPPKLTVESWQVSLFAQDFAKNVGLPVVAASQVRIYQRLLSLKAR